MMLISPCMFAQGSEQGTAQERTRSAVTGALRTKLVDLGASFGELRTRLHQDYRWAACAVAAAAAGCWGRCLWLHGTCTAPSSGSCKCQERGKVVHATRLALSEQALPLHHQSLQTCTSVGCMFCLPVPEGPMLAQGTSGAAGVHCQGREAVRGAGGQDDRVGRE